MQIRIIGTNIETGEALDSYVKEHLDKMIKKYFSNPVSAEIHFHKEGHLFKTLLLINEGVKRGIIVKADKRKK